MNPAPPAPPLRLPQPPADAHKGDFGRVLMIGGSRGMSGAMALASIAALRTGSGLVTAAVPDRCLEMVAAFDPCLMTLPWADTAEGTFAVGAVEQLNQLELRPDAIGCGPGLRTGDGAAALVEALAGRSDRPRVMDADALNLLARLPQWPRKLSGPAVLTPHPGEWSRLSGVPAGDRADQEKAAQQLAAEAGVVVVLKGHRTLITDGGRHQVNTTGNPGMATGGSGDVLTGIIASLLGQGLDPFAAASLGAWIHGRAGDRAAEQRGTYGMIARDLVEVLPWAVADAVQPRPPIGTGEAGT